MFPASRQVCVEECVLQCVCGVVGVVEGAVGHGPESFLVASDEGGEGVEVAVDVGGEQVLVAACVADFPRHGLRVVQQCVGYVGLARRVVEGGRGGDGGLGIRGWLSVLVSVRATNGLPGACQDVCVRT